MTFIAQNFYLVFFAWVMVACLIAFAGMRDDL